MVTEVFHVVSAGIYVAMLGGVAALADVYASGPDSFRDVGLVYAVSPTDEQPTRQSPALSGAS